MTYQTPSTEEHFRLNLYAKNRPGWFPISRYKFHTYSPPPKRQVHFTCGPNGQAEHPQPGFGQVGFTNSSRMQGPLHLAWTIHLHFCLRENDRINEAANATVDTAIAKMSKDMTWILRFLSRPRRASKHKLSS